MTMSNQIQLAGDFRHEEALASGTVLPGHLVELTTATVNTVRAHSVAGGVAERAFAVEDALQAKTIDDSYLTTTLVQYHIVAPGAVVNALIKAGETITKGEKLISGGDGTLVDASASDSAVVVDQVVAIALEAITTDSGVAEFCQVRVV